MHSELRHILLVRTDRIGDVILTAPAATRLKEHDRTARIAFLGNPYTAPLLKQHRDIDTVLTYEPGERHRGVVGILRLVREIRSAAYDAAILFYPRPALALALRLAGVPLRIGPGYRWYSLLLNRRIYAHRKKGNKHELEHNLEMLKALGIEISGDVYFRFEADGGEAILPASVRDVIGPAGYIIIHPGNGGSAPNLALSQYRTIIEHMIRASAATLFITGSPEERQLAAALVRDIGGSRVVNIAGKLDLVQLQHLIAGAHLFISSSTGPLHMANAAGVPVASYYCPSPPCSPTRWGPYHQPEGVLCPDVEPCHHGRPEKCHNGNCLEKLSGKNITSFVDRRLGAERAGRGPAAGS